MPTLCNHYLFTDSHDTHSKSVMVGSKEVSHVFLQYIKSVIKSATSSKFVKAIIHTYVGLRLVGKARVTS